MVNKGVPDTELAMVKRKVTAAGKRDTRGKTSGGKDNPCVDLSQRCHRWDRPAGAFIAIRFQLSPVLPSCQASEGWSRCAVPQPPQPACPLLPQHSLSSADHPPQDPPGAASDPAPPPGPAPRGRGRVGAERNCCHHVVWRRLGGPACHRRDAADSGRGEGLGGALGRAWWRVSWGCTHRTCWRSEPAGLGCRRAGPPRRGTHQPAVGLNAPTGPDSRAGDGGARVCVCAAERGDAFTPIRVKAGRLASGGDVCAVPALRVLGRAWLYAE